MTSSGIYSLHPMRADRVVSMMLLLERRGRMSAAQLADELGVSRRTVMRDIEALGTAGVPIYSSRGRDGGFQIWEGFRSQLRGITADEAAALSLLGTEQAAALLGLGDAAKRVRMKLEQSLPADLANEAATMHQRFHFDATPWTGQVPTQAIAFFEIAVRRRRVVRTNTSQLEQVEMHPLGIVLKAGEWFLVAEIAQGRQALPIVELHGYGTTGARFPYPEDFELAKWWRAHVAAAT